MKLEKMVCDSCGGSSFTKKGNQYECEYCGSTYIVDQDDNIVDKTLADAQIVQCYLEATKYMSEQKYSDELRALTKALDLDANNALTLVKLGRCYRSLGMQDKAISTYQRALEINPQMGTAYTNLGTIHLLNQRYREAAVQYEKGLPLISQSEADYWVAYANYAIAVAKLGNPSRARNMIDEAERHGYANADGCRKLAGLNQQGSNGGKQGCYVATALYGSYDCPEVWTLRRFRDNTLAETWHGRLFIRAYYAISPALVKGFGNAGWFRKMWKGKLDRMVAKLQADGVASTPYEDKNW